MVCKSLICGIKDSLSYSKIADKILNPESINVLLF